MSDELRRQLSIATTAATTSTACANRLHKHMLAALLNQDRCTLSNLICTSGTQHLDWTADYRLYSRDRVDEAALFGQARDCLLKHLPDDQPLVVALDDSIARKRGKKIFGVGWKRDPLGPPFQTNLVQAQRYLQFSAAWPIANGESRMVPIDFQHAPSPAKPNKKAKNQEQELANYREALKQQNLNRVSLERIKRLRGDVPSERHIVLNGDGSFTNKTILQGLPDGCTYIGRGRKDMALHYLPQPKAGKDGVMGRPRRYGDKAPTPEELRQDESVAWQRIGAFAAGRRHDFKIKTLDSVLWRKSGTGLPLRLVVIAPLGYRLNKGGKILYRKPAYLVCTDPNLSLEKLLQFYVWRWGIEVNFREEKSLVGTGQAQVQTKSSNQHLPAAMVAAYSLLWTSALSQVADERLPPSLAVPKWRETKESREGREGRLPSTGELQRILRRETWAGSLRPSTFYRFVSRGASDAKSEKVEMDLSAQLFSVA